MQKPQGYDETQVSEGFERIKEGGHYAVIKQVSGKKTKDGKDMLVILFDFAENDNQKGYFMNQYKNDKRPDKKYPNDATHYMTIDSTTDYGTKNLKSFCTMVEHSNEGFKVQWGNNFYNQFKGKKIGAVYGQVLDFYNGKEKKKIGFRWFCSTSRVEDAKIPDVYETHAHKTNMKNSAIANSDGFMSIPDGIEEELPFN